MKSKKFTQRELEHMIGAMSSYALRAHGKRQQEAYELLKRLEMLWEIRSLEEV